MKAKSLMLLASAFAATYDPSQSRPRKEVNVLPPKKNEPYIPQGCKLYLFDTNGMFTFERQPNKCYIEIVALNDKSAIKKFKNRNQ